jgi:hypothetical protein
MIVPSVSFLKIVIKIKSVLGRLAHWCSEKALAVNVSEC